MDPISLVKELEVLNSKGTKPNICASWMCKVITPYVDLLNRASERHRLDNYKAEFNLKYNLVITHMDLPIRYWNFECHNGDRYNHWIGGGLTPQKVAQFITNFLDIPMDRVYYNDSIESNIKEV